MKFKRFLVGLGIFILTIIFIVFVNAAINPKPKYESCYPRPIPLYEQSSSAYDGAYSQLCQTSDEQQLKTYKEKSFIIIMVLSVLAIIAGVLVSSVAPVSWGLVLGGLVTTIYVLIASFEDIGKPYRAIVSGAALAVLLWLAYAKLGDKEQLAPAQDANKPIPESNPESNEEKL